MDGYILHLVSPRDFLNVELSLELIRPILDWNPIDVDRLTRSRINSRAYRLIVSLDYVYSIRTT